ncbi:hypothetical protein TruAng_011790 [Truncatella angustata]|nr:hypothetical protein TruAng_011790 [Truncatella angustata]
MPIITFTFTLDYRQLQSYVDDDTKMELEALIDEVIDEYNSMNDVARIGLRDDLLLFLLRTLNIAGLRAIKFNASFADISDTPEELMEAREQLIIFREWAITLWNALSENSKLLSRPSMEILRQRLCRLTGEADYGTLERVRHVESR